MLILYRFILIIILFKVSVLSSNYLHLEGGFLYNTWAENDASQLLKLNLKTEEKSSTRKLPLQIIYCLDASQPMNGAPLNRAKESILRSLYRLSDEDLISVISYVGQPKVEVPLQKYIGRAKNLVHQSVGLIKYSNNRNLLLTIKKIEEQLVNSGLKNNAGTFVILNYQW